MPENSFSVNKESMFTTIEVTFPLPEGFLEVYGGCFMSLNSLDGKTLILSLIEYSESDSEIVSMVITSLVEAGFTQIQ